jgi:hypothetical protein
LAGRGRAKKKRICWKCHQQIKRAERWHHFGIDAEHWHCDNPTRGPGPIPDAEQIVLNIDEVRTYS